MTDPRIKTLAHNLIHYSCNLQPGEKILIENTGIQTDLVRALVESAYEAGGIPFVWLKDPSVERALLMGMTKERAAILADHEAALMAQMDAYVGLRAGGNRCENSDVPSDKSQIQAKDVWEKVHGAIRVPKTKWVVLRYPTDSMAQDAGMSTEAFEDFYFDVCNMNYAHMDKAMDPLVERMERTDKVHIIGPGTDLTFSIKGMPAIKCAGRLNIPDGEVYTAPVKDSVNGVIRYSAPSMSGGFVFTDMTLTFQDGRIVDISANDTARAEKIFNTDEGARFVGEFAIGVNPYILHVMKDGLFDEKVSGSFHFTPGAAYDDCDNGNRSAVHWDLVSVQTPEEGGGEIWFDDELIRKDGLFVPEYLHGLNPEHLKEA